MKGQRLLRGIGFAVAILGAFAALPASAGEATMSDEALAQYLVERSPWKGSWHGINNPYGNFSGTYDLVFRQDGKKLKAFVLNTQYIQAPPPPFDKPWDGEVTFLTVKKGKVSFAAPDKADVELALTDGKLTGTSWFGSGRIRIQNQHTLTPSNLR